MASSHVLPQFLHGRLQRYQAQTERCVDSLVSLADKAGHDLTQYYRQHYNARGRTVKRGDTTIYLAISDYLQLADSIANSPSAITIERTFFRDLEDVLSARRACAAWFADSDNEDVQASNRGHMYCIQVFEQVLHLLRPLDTRQQSAPTAPAAKQASVEEADNDQELEIGMDSMDLEEREDGEEQQGKACRGSKAKVITDEPAFAHGQAVFFACYCYLADLRRLRHFAKVQWQKYCDGSLSLSTAAYLSNTAVDLAEKLEKDLSSVVGKKYSYQATFYDFFQSRARVPAPLEPSDKQAARRDFSDDLPDDMTESILLGQYVTTQQFVEEIKSRLEAENAAKRAHKKASKEKKNKQSSGSDNTASKVSICTGPLPDTAASEASSPSAKDVDSSRDSGFGGITVSEYDLEQIRNTCTAHIMRSVKSKKERMALQSQHLRHLIRSVTGTESISMTTAFAVCLFLDVHSILEAAPGREVMKEFDEALLRLRSQANSHVAFLRRMGYTSDELFNTQQAGNVRPAGRAKCLRDVEQVVNGLLKNTNSYVRGAMTLVPNIRELMSNDPISCGLMLGYVRLLYHFASFQEVNCAGGTVISAMHFYNQGIQQGILTQSWPDLEHLIKVHAADFVFLGSRPSNPSTCLERYLRLYGTNARGKMGSEVRVRYTSFVLPKRALGSHFATVTRIVARRCWTADADCGGDLVQELEHLLSECRRKGQMHKAEVDDEGIIMDLSQLGTQSTRTKRMDMIELLSQLCLTLEGESKLQQFDLSATYRQVIEACELIEEELERQEIEPKGVPSQPDARKDQYLEMRVMALPLMMYAEHLHLMMQSEMGLVPKIVCQPETMSHIPQKYNACMKGLNTWLAKAEQEGRARMCQALDKT